MAAIEGSESIELCTQPTEDLFLEGDVLDNLKHVKADLGDDLSAYDAQMLENMSDFFQGQVESKSAGTITVSPEGESCTYWPTTRAKGGAGQWLSAAASARAGARRSRLI